MYRNLIIPVLGFLIAFVGCTKSTKNVVQESQALLDSGKYEEAIQMLEASYKSNPSLDSLKPVLANAHLTYGNFLMYKSELPPRQKYRKALSEYRRVLTLDPENVEAQKDKDLIESIYTQMGIPIPQDDQL